MMPIIKRTLLVLVWIIGIVMALSNIGVNISALLGTLGIGGIAFALAAQDTVKNIFGAFTILTDKPFSIGDTVRIDSLWTVLYPFHTTLPHLQRRRYHHLLDAPVPLDALYQQPASRFAHLVRLVADGR